MTLRIGIAGITGRMGRLLAEEVEAAGAVLAGGIGRGGDMAALAARADVVIDFTHASATAAHARALGEAGVGWVLGTSGLKAADEAEVAAAARRIPVVYAANFSPGVTLMLALAERMAATLPASEYDAEILENASPPEGGRALGHGDRTWPGGGEGARRGARGGDAERAARRGRAAARG